MCPVFTWWTSLETTPVTGSFLFVAPGCRLPDLSAGGIYLRVSRESTDLLLCCVRRVLRTVLWDYYWTELAMGGDSPADGRSGVDFNVQLQVSWNAPEAYVNLGSDGIYELKTVPDVLGLHARQPGVAVLKVLLGHDSWGVRALVPECKGAGPTSPMTPALPEGPVLPLDTEFFLAGDLSLMDRAQDLSLLPIPLLPLPSNFGLLTDTALGQSSVSGTSVEPTAGDLSREGPFDVYGTTSNMGDISPISDGLPGCPYQMTSYDRAEVVDKDLVYGLQIHHPRFLEYVGVLETARLLTRALGHWVRTMEREEAVTAALQLQHDAGLITGFRTIRMSSEVMRLAFGKEVFASEAVQAILSTPRVHCAAHYMSAMGLWRPRGPGAPWPVPISSCNNCMQCTDGFPDLTK